MDLLSSDVAGRGVCDSEGKVCSNAWWIICSPHVYLWSFCRGVSQDFVAHCMWILGWVFTTRDIRYSVLRVVFCCVLCIYICISVYVYIYLRAYWVVEEKIIFIFLFFESRGCKPVYTRDGRCLRWYIYMYVCIGVCVVFSMSLLFVQMFPVW